MNYGVVQDILPLVSIACMQLLFPQLIPPAGILTYVAASCPQSAAVFLTVPSPGACQFPDARILLRIAPNAHPSAAYASVPNPAKSIAKSTDANTIARSISSRMIFVSAIFCIIIKK